LKPKSQNQFILDSSDMGLLFDAESYSSDCRAWKEGASQAGHRGGASPVYPSYQFQERLAWTFVAGAVFFVRAKLAGQPEQWTWSSAAAHISGQNDKLVNAEPLLSIIKGDWRVFLAEAISSAELDDIRRHEQTGRPLGDASFISHLERLLGRELQPRKTGRKPKKSDN